MTSGAGQAASTDEQAVDGGRRVVTTSLHGEVLINEPSLSKGTAFTVEERQAFRLDGLLPPRVETIDEQLKRIEQKYSRLHDDLERHIFLRALQDTNEVLFYAFLNTHLTELMPIVYTPTVGAACQQFSQIYRRPHGLFLSYPDRHRLDELLASVERDIDVVVVTDGQRILGLGDQGLGGMGIPIGKLSLYSAVGGIDPATTLPILLDVGTDNQDLLNDPLYLGWHNQRVTGDDYDQFIEEFVAALQRRFPDVLLQWEDFASVNAAPLLDRYRDRLLSFNDDIQGTAAVALAAILAGLSVSDTAISDHPILIVGAGSAGTGIAGMLVETITRTVSGRDVVGAHSGGADGGHQVYLTDRHGILHAGRTDLADYQQPFARPSIAPTLDGVTDLLTIVQALRPSVLIGVSGQPGLFTEEVIGALADSVDRPVVMPLSNPTSRAEATPADILAWSQGRALVATGSPFDNVEIDGRSVEISQANNVYVFPGLGLGALISQAARVTDSMLTAAAAAVAEASFNPTESSHEPAGSEPDPDTGLLPDLADIHTVSRKIAVAVGQAAIADGVAPARSVEDLEALVDAHWWSPVYPTLKPAGD